ncbi:MAG: phosphatase PAP2 family protein [Actinomycetota bacterium]
MRRWNVGPATIPWTEVALEMIQKHRRRPSVAARALALLHTAMFDALVAACDSKDAYNRPLPSELDPRIDPLIVARGTSYPAERAAIAGAAEKVLTYLFPNEPPRTFEQLATQAVESRLYAGVNYRSDVLRGRALGRKVAELFIARGATDGSSNTGFSNPRPEGEQYWEPTPPGFEDPPIGGPVGTWTPWVMPAPNAARVGSGIPPPLEYESEPFMTELREVMDVQENLTSEQQAVAQFWDDGLGTFTPPGHWNQIAISLARSHRLGTHKTTRLFAYLNAAEADAAIAFFEAKYLWWSIRPVTAVRRLCDDQTRFCSKAELDPAQGGDPSRASLPDWSPFIATPPFPSYPSGHATFSGAGAAVLEAFFADAAGALNGFADQAANSRLLGGIHFDHDNDEGLVLGRAVAVMILERARTDGAN